MTGVLGALGVDFGPVGMISNRSGAIANRQGLALGALGWIRVLYEGLWVVWEWGLVL